MKPSSIKLYFLAISTLYAQSVALPTPPSTSLSISSGTTGYSAVSSITAAGNSTSVNISGTANVSFVAGVGITLLPGFTVTAASGSFFQASIAPIIPTPTFSPGTGTFASVQAVSISTQSGASIRYTTDGSTPSSTVGNVYTAPITVSTTTSLNAIGYASGYASSAIATAVYTFQPPASVTSITPTSAAPGTQVTISGSNFGSTKGTGAVWLGTTPGGVVTWSNTQIVATVASNATSGSAQVQQYGTFSNAPSFTVSTGAIATVTPASGLPGTTITIAGSGFGAIQGNGQVWLGTMNGIVQTWTDTQIVATVAAGSMTGKAQVLQNGVWSNPPIPFTINSLQITGIGPTSGAAGTTVTITGAGFGSSQGSGTVLLGSINGTVISWSDTQVMASVAAGSLTGVVRVQQSSVFSNAKSFTVPVSGNGGITLIPNLLNMNVGDTHTVQALGSAGQSVTGLTWTSSNTSVVSLSTTDPPSLTALAVGHVTITAGTASADVTVSAALPLGTVLWSNPGNGSGVANIIPAVPSASGVADIFALQNDGTVQAITSDGITAWTANIGGANVVPDFQGGLIVSEGDGSDGVNIFKLDGRTGLAYPTYNVSPSNGVGIAVHTDGTVFAMTAECTRNGVPPDLGECTESVIGIDPIAGTRKFIVPFVIPRSTPHEVHGSIIAGDGYYYVSFLTADVFAGPPDYAQTNHLTLLRVNSTGASDVLDHFLAYTNHAASEESNIGYVHMITNADTGIFLSLGTNDRTPSYAVTTTGTSFSVARGLNVPAFTTDVVPILQAQDGSFVGSYFNIDTNQTDMVGFDATGNVRWIVPKETPQIATADGGVIGQSGTTYDQNGNATGQVAQFTQSWFGNTYQIGSVDLTTSPSSLPQSSTGRFDVSSVLKRS